MGKQVFRSSSKHPNLSALHLLLLALVAACSVVVWHHIFLPTPADRFLSSRDRATALLNQPAQERFIPVSPEKPLLVEHRELAEQIAMRTMLRTIMWSEGTYPNAKNLSPYKLIFGYRTFEGFDKHPDICIPIEGDPQHRCSTGAGACQFITTTWDDMVAKYGHLLYKTDPRTGEAIGEFHPLNQELMCMILFADTGAYDPLMQATSVTPEGRIAMDKALFTEAIQLAAVEWASFPLEDGSSIGSDSGQHPHALNDIWQQFLEALEQEEAKLFPDRPNAALPEQKFGNWLSALVMDEDVAGYPVTSPFGMRMHPIYHVMKMHRGADVGAPMGTPIVAPVAGKNTCTKDGMWGTYAWFEPDDLTGRGFLSHHTSVCEEGHYNAGEVFAKVGNGDGSVGEHLHFETWRSVAGIQEPYNPPKGWVWAFLKGELPDEAIVDG